jgi:hypothetical protein
MPVTASVLFDMPQRAIADLIEGKLASSTATQIVCGFMTVEGMATLDAPIRANPHTVKTIVVGAGTYKAYEALDGLIAAGVPIDRLFVHLGHTRLTTSSARHRFYRYHPMLHSKIYYMEHTDETATAFVGSHNVTGFALMGLNGEASVLLEGPKNATEFSKIRDHTQNARLQSVPYTLGMKEAFSWWTHQFFQGLADKANDTPKEGESQRTIVILAEKEGKLPKKDDVVYFELPSALGTIQSLKAEVHIYVFDSLPPSPAEALQSLDKAVASFWCRTLGLEMERGGVELRADWHIDNITHPILKATTRPFRPSPTSDHQQVRVLVYYDVRGAFEYLFQFLRLDGCRALTVTHPLGHPTNMRGRWRRLFVDRIPKIVSGTSSEDLKSRKTRTGTAGTAKPLSPCPPSRAHTCSCR